MRPLNDDEHAYVLATICHVNGGDLSTRVLILAEYDYRELKAQGADMPLSMMHARALSFIAFRADEGDGFSFLEGGDPLADWLKPPIPEQAAVQAGLQEEVQDALRTIYSLFDVATLEDGLTRLPALEKLAYDERNEELWRCSKVLRDASRQFHDAAIRLILDDVEHYPLVRECLAYAGTGKPSSS